MQREVGDPLKYSQYIHGGVIPTIEKERQEGKLVNVVNDVSLCKSLPMTGEFFENGPHGKIFYEGYNPITK